MERHKQKKSKQPDAPKRRRWLSRAFILFLISLAAVLGYMAFLSKRAPAEARAHSDVGQRSVAQLVALSDAELERTDILEMNIAVAREIPGLEKLEYEHYRRIVDDWAENFIRWMPTVEHGFREKPNKYKNDVHFFQLGMLSQFLGHEVGIAYVEDQKNAQVAARQEGKTVPVYYTEPGQLLLHGLIDSKRGTCATMATLHVAIARRLGWPVSLASAGSHFVSRYEDDKVVYNIEMTYTDGAFSEGPDSYYMQYQGLPQKAIACGSDLRKLSGREMLGIFIASRGRYYNNTNRYDLAARDYALAFSLVPNNRCVYKDLVWNLVDNGDRLFNKNEPEHPASVLAYVMGLDVPPRPDTGRPTPGK